MAKKILRKPSRNLPRETGVSRLADRVGRLVRTLPGAEFAEEQLHSAELRVLRELKQRLDALDDHRRLPPPEDHAVPVARSSRNNKVQRSVPGMLLDDLLAKANGQTEEEARMWLYSMLLKQLTPDEVRILNVLSDGQAHPLLHVGVGPRIGAAPKRVVENFSTLGKIAQVKLREFTPAYITHLRSLNLIETGPEDKALDMKYQVLENDAEVRKAAETANKNTGPGSGARMIRRVLRISTLGRELWETCRPDSNK